MFGLSSIEAYLNDADGEENLMPSCSGGFAPYTEYLSRLLFMIGEGVESAVAIFWYFAWESKTLFGLMTMALNAWFRNLTKLPEAGVGA